MRKSYKERSNKSKNQWSCQKLQNLLKNSIESVSKLNKYKQKRVGKVQVGVFNRTN